MGVFILLLCVYHIELTSYMYGILSFLFPRDLMLELVSFAERVPKVSKGNMWKDSEVLR
jgi:hypothetical protein